MTDGPEPISADALHALRQELTELRVGRDAVAGTLREGEPTGDRADEADELQRADDVARIDRRIAEIEERIREAAVAGPPSTDAVGVGSTVTVRFSDGEEATFHLGELAEDLDEALITADSPLGRALLGCHAGETVTYDTPDGTTRTKILSLGPRA
ncbi:GreA/GreB family elongation factor [Streptomyces sp. SP17BM10]|uniref:GreA/GreB family elongation factor n=1 Tax=Streptomyces sp. SP17BM10 TaxID=3002530 RepID=UPI002E764870|nr:GreA/GreB family elongation factor [Streptomyces sp. SP17BM10]MEE1782908.1 GreA/GreB family elongation factor [Streptomyces sp. SP17BM10]